MEVATIVFVWMTVLTLIIGILAICSSYFAWWYITLRNPKLTELIVDAYKTRNEDKLK